MKNRRKPFRGSRRWLAFVAVAFFLAFQAHGARADELLEQIRAGFPEKVRAALKLIEEPDRELLAIRSYVRSARSLDDRWSWTKAEIADYEKSEAHQKAMEAVDAVIRAFEERNPEHTLYINRQVRSLDEQIEHWNTNSSVGIGGAEIGAAFAGWRANHPKASDADARSFLSSWKAATAVAIAAPGLSPHGRGHAFDFQIAKGGTIIAGANTRIIEEVWNAQGWTDRLKQAVTASGQPFVGPLESPHEPWHYDYQGGDLSKN